MKKRLKSYVVPLFSTVFCLVIVLSLFFINNVNKNTGESNFTYVSNSIINDTMPTIGEINNDLFVVRPYQSDQINIYKKFYDGNENKENSIIYYNGTYMQNRGIIYNSQNEFNVVSILNGQVMDVSNDGVLGFVVTIKHDNGLVSIYHGLSSISVNKGDNVIGSTVIGKSGELNFDDNLKNALLFELTKDGSFVNPENYYDRNINEL